MLGVLLMLLEVFIRRLAFKVLKLLNSLITQTINKEKQINNLQFTCVRNNNYDIKRSFFGCCIMNLLFILFILLSYKWRGMELS